MEMSMVHTVYFKAIPLNSKAIMHEFNNEERIEPSLLLTIRIKVRSVLGCSSSLIISSKKDFILSS
jgi:hypothetical protein